MYNGNTPSTKIGARAWNLVWWANPSVSEMNALPRESVGFPSPGTRNLRSLLASVEVRSDYAKANHPISYTITVHFRPRLGYNLGGLSYADAYGPLANGTALYASMWPGEVNYYRVSLLPGGVLNLSGTLTNEDWGLGAFVAITVRNMQQQWQASLLSQTVPNNASHDPNGVTVNFTSPTFTNSSGQAQDFYIVIENANSARLQDMTINVTGNLVPPPQLTLFLDADDNLFLDADGNASTIAVSDHPKYVPGAILATGISVSALPQSLKLVAAYTNASGQIVPPPSWAEGVTFTLPGTSAFKGSAMNFGSETTPDFDLGACVQAAAGGGCQFDTSDHTARISLSCRDYGGYTTTAAADPAGAMLSMRVPHDTGNVIPDVGWRVYERLWDEGSQDFVYVLVELVPDAAEPEEDEESPPGAPGDNLTVFEEFRGFMIRGVHYRTSPSVKDIFLYSYVLGSSLDDAASIVGLKWHTPFQSEISASRRINFNAAGVSGHYDQQAILMFNQPVSGGNANEAGSVPCSPSLPFVCYPNVIGYTQASYPNYEDWDPIFNVQIHESVIRAAAPDALEAEAIRAVIGHELGHAINIFHNQDQASIMKEGFETLSDWNNLTHVFLVPSDTSQIRLK